MQTINMNSRVKVKLTELGRRIHKENHDRFYSELKKYGVKYSEYIPPKEDLEGYSEWQLWVLMEEFGPHIRIGMCVPFDTEIIVI